ncbi:GlxA family transcriptional regulator [Suttonella ornithocola]|uniref:L-rhamnose operon transcriptional activator rhaR n=1 Tax=Suttonella ornithocola TaxID=279832 RepID=A0A380MSN1_9GAMM|nr:helix-turn-helix domain-containing protein [Suttonella ornithocola]SUO95312.1 L-rhamnose operon transcriptional activator rhaR [Suttonella ornithocola]
MTTPQVALVLHPQFNPFQFAIPQRVFSLAIEDNTLFHLNIVAEKQEDCYGEQGISVPADGDLSLLEAADIVVCFGWHDLAQAPSPAMQQAFQAAYQRGALMVGLCYGAYPLAYSGILNGKKATTHWLGEADFRRRFPHIHLDIGAIYIEEEQVMTSAGTAAALDCCLALVRRIYGVKIANQLARVLVVSPHREGGQAQFLERPIARPTASENINQLIESIQQNLTQNHSINALSDRLNMSRSTFTRHFRQATGMAFTEWLIEIRLQHARELLESTNLTIEHIANQSGFHSATALRQHFKHKYHISPRIWRKRFGEKSYS